MLGPYTKWGGDGIEAFSIIEIEKGHEEEGLLMVTKSYFPYMKVEGYKVEVTPILTAADALALME